MRRGKKRDESSEWTDRDAALLYTCHVGHLVQSNGDLGSIAEVLAPFPPRLGAYERLWVAGPFVLRDFYAPGDGSWQARGFIAGGTGALGVGMLVGSVIGSANARSRARAQAAADAVPRWVPIGHGTLYVSRYGFYMQTPAVFSWGWSSIDSASMVGPGVVHFSGTASSGPVSWVLEAPWAELVFLVWALNRHRGHPQLVAGGWLPPGWVERAVAHGRPVPPGLTGLSPGG